jgi:hypothetical protein
MSLHNINTDTISIKQEKYFQLALHNLGYHQQRRFN